ncbi:G patch domain-containing protein 1 [Linnemannia gamsii]|uniref:G patch domain-containing protein 1 n=1 Tax=Linnemannia gamsii TaxID=64522 RepID=A0ABQ7JJZ8_9FUNG|nr:G patch domain-containing protein 1 [Linnemannia gamsii]
MIRAGEGSTARSQEDSRLDTTTPSGLQKMLSDATRIAATDDFGSTGSAHRDLARKRATAMSMQASGSVLGVLSDNMIDDLIIPTSESIGARLLKRMGWKPGQGIGPRVSKRQRNANADNFSDDDTSADITFAPIDSAVIVFANKSNHFGLGFDPHKDAPEFDASVGTQSGSRYLSGTDSGVTGARLGFGLLNNNEDDEDDDEVFGSGPNHRHFMEMDMDTTVSPNKRRKSSHGNTLSSNSKTASTLAYCSDGRPPLTGFILIATMPQDPKRYIAPIVPSNFTPRHIFISDGKTTGSTKQHGGSKLTADDRALVLGETPIDAPRRSVFEYMSSENKSRLDGALGFVLDVEGEKHLRKDHWEVPKMDISAAKAALQGFMPFSDDVSKQQRYKQYLNVQAGLSTEKIEMVEGFSGENMNKELNEFAQAARIFKPLSTSMSSRFTTASKVVEFQQLAPGLRTGADIQSSPAEKSSPGRRVIECMEIPKSQAAKAAEMGMFGPLTRSMADFYPNKLLCKRFNVPDPHPEHKDVGPDTAKDLLDKATMDSMLMARSSAGFSTSGEVLTNTRNEGSLTTGLSDEGPEPEMEQAEPPIQTPLERPPMDIFKAIFDDSDSGSDSDAGMDLDVDTRADTMVPSPLVNPNFEATGVEKDKAVVAAMTQGVEGEQEGSSAVPFRPIFIRRTNRQIIPWSPRADSPNQAPKISLRRVDNRTREEGLDVESDDAQIGPRLDLSERGTTTTSTGRAKSGEPTSTVTGVRHHSSADQKIDLRRSTLTSTSHYHDSGDEFIGPPVAPSVATGSTFSAPTPEESGRSGRGRKETEDPQSESFERHEPLTSRKDEGERSRSGRSRSERSSRSLRRSPSVEHTASRSRRVEAKSRHSAAPSHSDDDEHHTDTQSDGTLSTRKSNSKTRGTDDRAGDRQDAESHGDRAKKDRKSTRRHKEHRSRPSDKDRELNYDRNSSSRRHKHSRSVRGSSERESRHRDRTQDHSNDRHARALEDEDDLDGVWVEKESTGDWVEKEPTAPDSANSTQATFSSRSRPRAAAFF